MTWNCQYEALAAASSCCKFKAFFDMLLLQTCKPCGRTSYGMGVPWPSAGSGKQYRTNVPDYSALCYAYAHCTGPLLLVCTAFEASSIYALYSLLASHAARVLCRLAACFLRLLFKKLS